MNYARTLAYRATRIGTVRDGAIASFPASGSYPFTMHIERAGTNYVVNGIVRQDGRNATSAQCVIYGVSVTIPAKS